MMPMSFDDRMLADAMTYARTLVKKLEAMEEPTSNVEDALDLMRSVIDDLSREQREHFDRKRGLEEVYRWIRKMITSIRPTLWTYAIRCTGKACSH